MPRLERRLALLARQPAPVVADVLAEAVRSADDDELRSIALAAARTGDPFALAEVVRVVPRLGEDGLAFLRDLRRRLLPALRIVMADARPRQLREVIELVGRLAEPALLATVAPRLLHRDPEITEAAAAAFYRVTEAVLGPHGRWKPRPDAAADLDAALAEAGRDFREHRARPVLLAIALAAASPGPRLASVLAVDDNPVSLALRSVPDRLDLPLVRRNLLAWLGESPLSRAASRRLAGVEGPAALSDVLHRGHLLLVPARRRALRQVDRPIRCAPGPAVATRLSPAAQATLPRYLSRLGLHPTALVPKLAALRSLSEPRGRLYALLELMGRASHAARTAAGSFVDDACGPVAHAAALHATGEGPCETGLLEQMERSPHRLVAAAGRDALARSGAEAWRGRWSQLSPGGRLAAARLLLERDEVGLVDALRSLIDGDDADIKLSAILLARRLGVVPLLLAAVAVEVKNDDLRIASAAVAALAGPAGDDEASLRRAALQFGLDHADSRVRANAIEALLPEDLRRVRRTLTDLAYRDANRPRANAVFALGSGDARDTAGTSGGLAALRTMLRDPRPPHRVSAIWVARRQRARVVADDLRAMADDDPAPEIRVRARQALGLITHPSQGPGPIARVPCGGTT